MNAANLLQAAKNRDSTTINEILNPYHIPQEAIDAAYIFSLPSPSILSSVPPSFLYLKTRANEITPDTINNAIVYTLNNNFPEIANELLKFKIQAKLPPRDVRENRELLMQLIKHNLFEWFVIIYDQMLENYKRLAYDNDKDYDDDYESYDDYYDYHNIINDAVKIAVDRNDPQTVKRLMELGIEVGNLDETIFPYEIFEGLAENNNIEMIKQLIMLNDKKDTPEWMHTLLLRAARRSNSKLVQYLIEAGDNIDARDRQGMTPLMWAFKIANVRRADSSRFDMAKYLIDHDANVLIRDNKGNRALDYIENDPEREMIKSYMIDVKGKAMKSTIGGYLSQIPLDLNKTIMEHLLTDHPEDKNDDDEAVDERDNDEINESNDGIDERDEVVDDEVYTDDEVYADEIRERDDD